jgi:hypothetical protein
MKHEQDASFTVEQANAADAAQALVDLLRAAPLKPNQMERFHLLLGRTTDASLKLIDALDLLTDD